MPKFVSFAQFFSTLGMLFAESIKNSVKVHITQGDYEGKAVIVSWITADEQGSSSVQYFAENNSKLVRHADGIVLSYKFYNYTSGYIHHCTLTNLEVCTMLRLAVHSHCLGCNYVCIISRFNSIYIALGD